MAWVLAGGAWLAVGVVTSRVAASRGHDRGAWLLLGLVFPGAALAAVLLGYPRTHVPGDALAPDLAEALRDSRVAAALARRPGRDEAALQAATGLPADRVAGELRTLRFLGLASRARDRTWRLTPRAAAELARDRDS